MRWWITTLAVLWVWSPYASVLAQPSLALPAHAEESRYVPPPTNEARYLTFISDLHLGLGANPTGDGTR